MQNATFMINIELLYKSVFEKKKTWRKYGDTSRQFDNIMVTKCKIEI